MRRVLVADDDEPIRTLLIRVISREGYAVTAVPDGIEAIERLKEGEYDAVILDLMMPRANGADVLNYMRAERPRQVPRTILSSAADAKKLAEYRKDICAVVSKPFDLAHLTGLVAKCVEKAQAVNTPESGGQYGPSNN